MQPWSCRSQSQAVAALPVAVGRHVMHTGFQQVMRIISCTGFVCHQHMQISDAQGHCQPLCQLLSMCMSNSGNSLHKRGARAVKHKQPSACYSEAKKSAWYILKSSVNSVDLLKQQLMLFPYFPNYSYCLACKGKLNHIFLNNCCSRLAARHSTLR